jgi:hypothetical protein
VQGCGVGRDTLISGCTFRMAVIGCLLFVLAKPTYFGMQVAGAVKALNRMRCLQFTCISRCLTTCVTALCAGCVFIPLDVPPVHTGPYAGFIKSCTESGADVRCLDHYETDLTQCVSEHDPGHLSEIGSKEGYQLWGWFPGARTRVVECLGAKGYQPYSGLLSKAKSRGGHL